MKIAQISPLIESVPPRLYGGTERVVAYLTDELVRQGHEVSLFASGDSRTNANLISACPQALRLDRNVRDHIPFHLMMMEQVRRLAPGFDILHFHTDLVHFPVFSGTGHATLTTLHGRQDLFELRNFYTCFPDMPLVSISNAQRNSIPDTNFVGTVLHGLLGVEDGRQVLICNFYELCGLGCDGVGFGYDNRHTVHIAAHDVRAGHLAVAAGATKYRLVFCHQSVFIVGYILGRENPHDAGERLGGGGINCHHTRMNAVTKAQLHPELPIHIYIAGVWRFPGNFTQRVQAYDRLTESNRFCV